MPATRSAEDAAPELERLKRDSARSLRAKDAVLAEFRRIERGR